MPKVQAPTVAEHRRRMLSEVFRAFEERICELGYDAVTLAEIAKAVGIARTAMYNYFPDKQALLLAYTAHEMDEFFSSLRLELSRVDDPLEKLDVYVRAQVAYFSSHHLPPGPALRSVLSAAAYREMHVYAALLEETLTAILDEAVGEGLVPGDIAADADTIRLLQATLAASSATDGTADDLERAIAVTQAFVRRAIGALEVD